MISANISLNVINLCDYWLSPTNIDAGWGNYIRQKFLPKRKPHRLWVQFSCAELQKRNKLRVEVFCRRKEKQHWKFLGLFCSDSICSNSVNSNLIWCNFVKYFQKIFLYLCTSEEMRIMCLAQRIVPDCQWWIIQKSNRITVICKRRKQTLWNGMDWS